MMNRKGAVVEHQEHDTGLPWQESLCLQTLIDCACSSTMSYIRVVVFVSFCSLFHVLNGSHMHNIAAAVGGLNYKVKAYCLVGLPLPSFS